MRYSVIFSGFHITKFWYFALSTSCLISLFACALGEIGNTQIEETREFVDLDNIAECTFVEGNAVCSCPIGYNDVNEDGTLCTDINECNTGSHNCDPQVVCTNTYGGFSCGSCPAGYRDVNKDGTFCDTLTWIECAKNPTIEGELEHPWMQNIGDPFVLKDGSTYKMWFAAEQIDVLSETTFATSADGIVWNVHSETVLKVGAPGSWDALNAETPTVIKNTDGSYEMWYSGNASLPNEPITWDMLYKIGHATSPDGVTWTKTPTNPVLDIDMNDIAIWDALSVADPSVIKDGDTYKMWFAGGTFVVDTIVIHIGYATSPDGITWTKYEQNPVFTVGEAGSWDSGMVSQPSVFYDGERYIMFYAGSPDYTHPEATDIGIAFSDDGINWERLDSPIIIKGKTSSWNGSGIWGPTGIIDGDNYRVWFTGGLVQGESISTGFGCLNGS